MTVLASDAPDLSALESQDVQKLAALHEAEMGADATVLAPDMDVYMSDAPEPAMPGEPLSPMPALDVKPPTPATPDAGAARGAVPEASQVLAEIAPQMRKQVHDTLEKIAWESFSDVTEKIVRQAVEKIETIAWEVIPQLAESLVREEIRKMKDEPKDPG